MTRPGDRALLPSLAVFVACFTSYLLAGYHLALGGRTTSTYSFDLDCDKMAAYFDITNALKYRTKVHPIIVLLVDPIGRLIRLAIPSLPLTILFLQSIVSACAVTLLYRYLRRVAGSGAALLFCLLYAVSLCQLLFTLLPETFVFAGCFLILMHLVFKRALERGRRLPAWLLVPLGVLSLGITVTNIAQFAILLTIYLYVVRRRWPLLYAAFIMALVVGATSLLASVQQRYYPYTVHFLPHLLHPGEESGFMRFDVGSALWARELFANAIVRPWKFTTLRFDRDVWFANFYLHTDEYALGALVLAATVASAAVLIWRPRAPGIAALFCLLYNLALHSVYGRDIGYLYSQQYTFLYLILFAYGYSALPRIAKACCLVLIGAVAAYVTHDNAVAVAAIVHHLTT